MEQQSGAVLLNKLIANYSLDVLNKRRNLLKAAFARYRSMASSDPLKQILTHALIAYGNTCVKAGGEQQRRFEVFIRKYVDSEQASNRQIATDTFEATRTFYRDIDHVIDKLMVLVYGVDGLEWK